MTGHPSIAAWLTRSARAAAASIESVRCSFCGRVAAEVEAMVSGPKVYICDQCVQRAAHVIAEARRVDADAST